MAVKYTTEQNNVFMEVMEEYRRRIEGATPEETKRLTKVFAKELVSTVPLFYGRSENGIAERLVYFDNLLAGVAFPFEYYLKSTFNYFGKLPRKNDDKYQNKWKTQHESRRERP
ncbi:hypothetical protein D1B31_02040 [Neobacillus notoginsengisoli]|uniref:Uncharacterized protein n=1 Tax=Neobacillus notoginsengisoli TaxID=1578198 RepID=A0A417YZY8_9BACI|nr:hypothetical protein [Neobacillus notoginsengisoli]RHW43463.1 hypothetical protein D1B31_02040 [Neobacillus notoginsengisoli]